MALFGPQDKFLRMIRKETAATIHSRDADILIEGPEEEVENVRQLFETLLQLIRGGTQPTEQDIRYAWQLVRERKGHQLLSLFSGDVALTFRGKEIRPRTLGQRHYLSTIRKKEVVFGIGPAGTGKTYLAVVAAVAALKEGSVKKIVLTRPAVEAGENLGFLPGDMQEKVDPYLRPLYDALNDVMGPDGVGKAMDRGLIEIAPLAFMRGRTLEDSFVILDEAQNTTPEQMKMFLTRLGIGSRMVITGDVTQIDLPRGARSGLIEAERILRGVEEIGFVYFAEQDVVRHHLVQKIILAYQADRNQ
jgi:phosphate starvation-inducible PhoH-like protein